MRSSGPDIFFFVRFSPDRGGGGGAIRRRSFYFFGGAGHDC